MLLVIDITSNGGGTNWYEPAARTLSAKTLQPGAFGFIRHPHWTKQMKERLSTIEAEILKKTSSPKLKKLLTQTAENLTRRNRGN
jgi:FixJ family two-component response regulator